VISFHHACFFACEVTRHAGLDAAADSDEPADTPAFAFADADIAKTEAVLAPIPPSPAAASTLSAPANGQPPAIYSARLEREIAEMDLLITLARSVQLDEKTRALVTALRLGLDQLASSDARRKAVNFAESRRTQEYLKRSLEATGRLGKAVLFNGSLGCPAELDIYGKRAAVNRLLGRLSDSRVADRRQAILEHFRDGADILFATESAAEGINFQFCSLVIIYDLQWNQQLIGRCHRYGKTHDVVVINFLNQANAATKFRCSNSTSSTSRTPTTAACMVHVSRKRPADR
jgi:ERCC4-related helicase